VSATLDRGGWQPPLAWSWALPPLAIATGSRIFSAARIWLANGLGHPHRLNPFVAWDAGWYLQVARSGYHAVPVTLSATNAHYDFAFFPLWPAAIRLSTLGLLPAAATSVVLANLLFIAGAVLAWKLLAERFDPGLATGAVALLAFSPPAYVFSLAYSEPLFLLLAAAYFLGRTHPLRRGLLAALAMAARISGAAIVASAALEAWLTRGRERRAALLSVVLGAAAFAAWWLFIAWLVHDPLGFLRGSPSWGRSSGVVQILDQVRHLDLRRLAALGFTGLVLVGSLLVLRRDRELGVYALVAVALGLLPGGLIASMPRYSLVAFPAFAGLAKRLGRRGTLVLVVLFALAQWFFVSWSFLYPHVQPP
jgi:hypothetical protein